jgi:hypothetical protein
MSSTGYGAAANGGLFFQEIAMALPVNQPVNEVAVFAKTASVGSTPLIAQTVAPVKGRIVRTYAVLEGTITIAPAAIAVAINGGSNIGSLSIPVGIAGSGASDVPSAAGVSKDVQEGDFISFTPSGATGSNIPAQFVAVIRQ